LLPSRPSTPTFTRPLYVFQGFRGLFRRTQETRTWLKTISFSMWNPSSRSNPANCRARWHNPSTSSSTPLLPRAFSVAQSPIALARRDISGVQSIPSRFLLYSMLFGAPKSPLVFTSHPRRFNISFRPAARPHIVALEVPLTKPATVSAGSPNSSFNHSSHVVSSRDRMGDITYNAAFRPHSSDSYLAAKAAGIAPPFTKPKYLPPVWATMAGDP